MKIKDIDGHRAIEIQAMNRAIPTSVFIMGPRGLCVEVDKEEFVAALCRDFGLAPIVGVQSSIAA